MTPRKAEGRKAKSTYRKSETSRQQVLDAAIRTFAESGLAGTRVSDIAAAAGMSKGVVHYHFASKDDLIVRVLGQCCDALADRVRGAWRADGTPTDKIRRALREMWATRTDGSPEMRVLSDLMALGVHDAKIKKPVALFLKRSRDELVTELVASFEALGLRPKLPPRTLPRLMMATLDGLGLHQIFDPPSESDQQEIVRALELFAFALFEL